MNSLSHPCPSKRPFRFEPLEDRRMLAFNPTAFEQEMLEHINRMRLDPQAELGVLFSSIDPLVATDPNVQAAVNYFQVDGELLASQWSELAAVAPLAWNEMLHEAATAHNQEIISHDSQSHQLPGEPGLGARIGATGYDWSRLGENIFAFANSVFHGHAGFAVDWGFGAGGIQSPPGHRNNIMSSSFQEIGIAITEESNSATQVGPLVITQDFGAQWSYAEKLVGVVYTDSDANGRYTAGEGVGGVTITASGANGTFTTATMSAGGYQMAVSPGTYTVTASGGSLNGVATMGEITIAGQNAKIDLETLSTSVETPSHIVIDGNTAYVHGTDAGDVFRYEAGEQHTVMVNETTYELDASQISYLVFQGGANDTIRLYGGDEDERVIARRGDVSLSAESYQVEVTDFDDVRLFAGSGSDEIRFYDTPSNDVFVGKPGWSRLSGHEYVHRADGFDRAYAYSTSGGHDRAYLYDGLTNDTFVGRPEWSLLRASENEYSNRVAGFDRVYAYATAGGQDRAYLYDSVANDTFVGRPEWSLLRGPEYEYYNRVASFDRVYAYATAGGQDSAYQYDSPATDIFVGRPEWSLLRGSENEYYNRVASFDRVYAYATAGGFDRAYLYDSLATDIFIGRPAWSLLRGANFEFYHRVTGFDRVFSYSAAGGADKAYLYDSASPDTFVGRGEDAQLSGPSFFCRVSSFERVTAYSTVGSGDRASVAEVDYVLGLVGDWHNF